MQIRAPLIRVACPPLSELTDPTVGGMARKLVEVAGQYHKCRAAALGGEQQ